MLPLVVNLSRDLLVLTPCSVAVGYQRFEGPCCWHLQGEYWFYRFSWYAGKAISDINPFSVRHSHQAKVASHPSISWRFLSHPEWRLSLSLVSSFEVVSKLISCLWMTRIFWKGELLIKFTQEITCPALCVELRVEKFDFNNHNLVICAKRPTLWYIRTRL
jgi:hypothetical protein